MSEQSSKNAPEPSDQDGRLSVTDDQLPEDLQPTEDNPLARPAGEDVPDDVLKDTTQNGGGDDSSGGWEDASKEGGSASDASHSRASSDTGSDTGPAEGSEES